MKTILDLNSKEAKDYFLRQENYFSLDLPEYFNFQNLLKILSEEFNGKKLKDFLSGNNPNDLEEVNLTLLNNKDGKIAWRPFQLIHPVIYVYMVQEMTNEKNWELITSKFNEFKSNSKIICNSIAVVGLNDKTAQQNQVFEWWQNVEQRSLALSLEYSHLLHLDITDCYGSIYSHSIAWALHGKAVAKKKENRNNQNFIGVVFDKCIQIMSYGQTNGIPQGSVLMDFIAEMVLGLGDVMLTEELNKLGISDYKIIRHRDDYRIFTNNSNHSLEIAKVLSEVLAKLNFRINAAKTNFTDDVVLGSLKPDKVNRLLKYKRTYNIQKRLMQLYVLGKEFPNSGSLHWETKDFLDWLKSMANSENGLIIENPDVIIAILVNLACNNPRLFAIVIASISIIIPKVENEEIRKILINKIIDKFNKLPNTAYLNVWLQRLTLKVDPTISYSGKLCDKVQHNNVQLWNSDWLNQRIKKIVSEEEVINRDVISKMGISLSAEEIEKLGQDDQLYY